MQVTALPVLRKDGNGDGIEQRFKERLTLTELCFRAFSRGHIEIDREHPGCAILNRIARELHKVVLTLRLGQAIECELEFASHARGCHLADGIQVLPLHRRCKYCGFDIWRTGASGRGLHHRVGRVIHVAPLAVRVVANDGHGQVRDRYAVPAFCFSFRVIHIVKRLLSVSV